MYGYGYSLYNQVPFGRGGIDPSASAFFTATGITGATQQAAIDNLVKGLKADGLWSKMKAVYPFVTDNKNLFGYTEDFASGWNNAGTTVTPNTTIAPNGTLTADTALFSSTSQSYVRASNISVISGQTYTISVYVKKSSSSPASNIRITTNNTIAWNTGISQKFALTDSWQRITLSGVLNSSGTLCYILFGSTNIDGNADSTCGGNVDIWGAQLELGSTATTYQPIATTQQAYIASQFKYNLVNPVDSDAAFRLVFNGGWTHSSTGATPNGTNGYADTKLVPSSVLTQNNASLGYYGGNNTGAIVDKSAMGSIIFTPARVFTIEPAYPTFGLFGDVNDGSTTFTANSDTSGFIFASRNSSTQKIHSIRGTQTVKNEVSIGIPTSSVAVGARNANGSIQNYSAIQHRFTFISEGFNTTEAANLYTRVQAYQTALSRQV